MLSVPVAAWALRAALRVTTRGRAPVTVTAALNGGEDDPGSVVPRRHRRTRRVATNVALAAIIFAYPLLRGTAPVSYYRGLLPSGPRTAEFVHGAGLALIYLGALYAAWLATDHVRIRPRLRRRRLGRRLAVVPFSALFGAAVEELVFRGVVQADAARAFGPTAGIAVGTLAFAAAHYARRVKRYWTFPGHAALGLVLSVAFARSGALWLPIGLHAGGIFIIMGLRPLVRYHGPPWLVGASIFPYAGAVGVIGLLMLAGNVWLEYGVAG